MNKRRENRISFACRLNNCILNRKAKDMSERNKAIKTKRQRLNESMNLKKKKQIQKEKSNKSNWNERKKYITKREKTTNKKRKQKTTNKQRK